MQEKKKRLLITASTFPRYENDSEPRFILDLAKELQKYFEVTVLVPAGVGARDREVLEGVSVERYHYFPLHKWETLCYPGAIVPRIREKKVRALLVPFLFVGLYLALLKRRNRYDYVHAHWLIPQGIVQSLFGIPYVLTGHGGDVTSLNKGIIRSLKRKAVRRAKVVTVVSDKLKEELLAIFPDEEKAVITGKLMVQPMGCDMKRFHPPGKADDLWKQGKRKVVLYVGRLAEKKGVRYLIEAMQWVEGTLVIAGDGPLRRELQEQAEALRLEDRVVFLGARTHQELPAIYASADVCVVPSVVAKDQDKEGFGLVILEAMASGIPVVASESGGITEIIRNEYNGLLVEEKNSRELAYGISRLLSDEGLRRKLINNMVETVEKYDYNEVGRRYAELISR